MYKSEIKYAHYKSEICSLLHDKQKCESFNRKNCSAQPLYRIVNLYKFLSPKVNSNIRTFYFIFTEHV